VPDPERVAHCRKSITDVPRSCRSRPPTSISSPGCFNAHLGAVVPGFALPAPYLASRLVRDPGEAVVDPWVVRRRTLLALEREHVVAAAHVCTTGPTGHVGPAFRNAGEVAWLVAWPSAREAARAVLAAGLGQLAD
jgi:hypothetical protein